MEAGPSGHRPPRFPTVAALKMLDEMSDVNLGILSDDDSVYGEDGHRSSNSSNLDSDTDDVDLDDVTPKKGMLPSNSRCKKFTATARKRPTHDGPTTSSKKDRPRDGDLDLDLDLDQYLDLDLREASRNIAEQHFE
ncbi:hypothetical protein PoB_000490500 [Plakobranchus ocellatus]|uniref:Uncharacterized protein n=1 Tax=Plakobranchus ocellatus TaxID=259542 RepID=A0AAV3Y7E2_9GAST|nr:hypothetical protein PoB_000490500 [Plakobranchus ocellatus]